MIKRVAHGRPAGHISMRDRASIKGLCILPCLSRHVRTSMATTTKSKHANPLHDCAGETHDDLGYNGIFPGPTIKARRGRRDHVRFTSKLQPRGRHFMEVTLLPTQMAGRPM